MVRNAVPHMIKQNYGRIVLFSSGSGLGSSGQTNYSAAKEGMVGFTRSLAKELAEYDTYIQAIDFITVLQTKARTILEQTATS